MNSKFYVIDNQTGFMVDSFDSFDDALKAIDGYMKNAWAEGNRRIDLYSVADEDRHVLHRYMVKIDQGDGSSVYTGPVISREDYTSVELEVFS